jgi:hypothetical protein
MSDDIPHSGKKIQDDIVAIHASLARIEASCNPCRKKVEHLAELIHGTNGQGHGVRIAKLEQTIKVLVAVGVVVIPILTAVIAAVLSRLI